MNTNLMKGKKTAFYFRYNNWDVYLQIGDNERTPNVLKTILEKFCLDPSTYDHYCIEQKLPDRSKNSFNMILNIFLFIRNCFNGSLQCILCTRS